MLSYCIVCGNLTQPYKVHSHLFGNRKTCSDKCLAEFRRNRKCYESNSILQVERDTVVCQLCLKQIDKNARGRFTLRGHINSQHIDTTYKEYYDTYLKKDGEGLCKICTKETNFRPDRDPAYMKFCSTSCSSKHNVPLVWNKPGYRENMSQHATTRVKDPKNNFGFPSKKKRSPYNNKPTWFNGIRYRSKFEARVATRLFKAGILFEYEKKLKLDTSYCLPDFYLPKYDLFIELRPKKIVDEKLLLKVRRLKTVYGKEVVIVVDSYGAGTLISRLEEKRKPSSPDMVWIFEGKQGELKENKSNAISTTK